MLHRCLLLCQVSVLALMPLVSCLPQLVFVLPLFLRPLPSGGASICLPLVALPPLVEPLFFYGVLASCPLRLFVVSPLVMPLIPPPPVCLCLSLSLHRRLSSGPSRISFPNGFCVASHNVDASCLPAPPTLVMPSPLVAPLLCLLSTLAGCQVASNVVQNDSQLLDIAKICKPKWNAPCQGVRRPQLILACKASEMSQAIKTFPSP